MKPKESQHIAWAAVELVVSGFCSWPLDHPVRDSSICIVRAYMITESLKFEDILLAGPAVLVVVPVVTQ